MKMQFDNLYNFLKEDERQALFLLFQFLSFDSSTRDMSIGEFARVFLPPVSFGNFHILLKEGAFVGFASWAFFSEQTERKFLGGEARLDWGDWNSGDRLWLMDFICGASGRFHLARSLRKELQGRIGGGKPSVKLARVDRRGRVARVIQIR